MTTYSQTAPTVISRHRKGTLKIDWFLLVPMIVLLCIGILLVYTSSVVYADRYFKDPQFFLKKHLLHVFCGLLLFYAMTELPRGILVRYARVLFIVSVVLCILVLIPGIGTVAGGARRWLRVGALNFQPSEFAKLCLVIFLAYSLSKREQRPGTSTPPLLAPFLLVQIPLALILAEPDLGAPLVTEAIIFAMIFVAGLPLRVILGMTLLSIPLVYHMAVSTPFRLQRLLSFIDPWAYRSSTGYQVTEALISIGSGGFSGVGLGAGKQKLFFLPEAHTDFIFAILGEELGLLGILLVVTALVTLVARGFKIAMTTPHPFDRLLGVGLTSIIAVPALLNMAVVTGLLPTKGLPLPFISYGGSHLVTLLVAIGLLMRMSRDTSRPEGNKP